MVIKIEFNIYFRYIYLINYQSIKSILNLASNMNLAYFCADVKTDRRVRTQFQ